MLANEAIKKLHDIFNVLIGDSADEWRSQKQQGSFQSDNVWAQHLLAVHKHSCQEVDCQINKHALQLLSSRDMDLSMKKRPSNNNNDTASDLSDTARDHPKPVTNRVTASQKIAHQQDNDSNPFTAHRGVGAEYNGVGKESPCDRASVEPRAVVTGNRDGSTALDSNDAPLNFTKETIFQNNISNTEHSKPTAHKQSNSTRKTIISALLSKPAGGLASDNQGTLLSLLSARNKSESSSDETIFNKNELYRKLKSDRLSKLLSASSVVDCKPDISPSPIKHLTSASHQPQPIQPIEASRDQRHSSPSSVKHNVSSPMNNVVFPIKNEKPLYSSQNNEHNSCSPTQNSRKSRRKSKHPTSIKEMIPCTNEDDDYEALSQFKVRKLDDDDQMRIEHSDVLSSTMNDMTDDDYDLEDAEDGYYGDPTRPMDNCHGLKLEDQFDPDESPCDYSLPGNQMDEDTEGTVSCLICQQEVSTIQYEDHLRTHKRGHLSDINDRHKSPGKDRGRARYVENSPYLAIADKIKNARANLIVNSIKSNQHQQQRCNNKSNSIGKQSPNNDFSSHESIVNNYTFNSEMAESSVIDDNDDQIDKKINANDLTESVSAFKRLAESPQNYRLNFSKNFPCDLCAKRFSSKRLLTVHMKSHSDERPHACMVCGKTFKHSSHKRRHENQHFNRMDASADDPSDAFIETITVGGVESPTLASQSS